MLIRCNQIQQHYFDGHRLLTFDQTSESKVCYDPEEYYVAALEERDTILRLGDTRALTYLMLLGQHVSSDYLKTNSTLGNTQLINTNGFLIVRTVLSNAQRTRSVVSARTHTQVLPQAPGDGVIPNRGTTNTSLPLLGRFLGLP